MSVFLSVQAITFEVLKLGTSFLVCRYIQVKFEHQGHWSRSNEKLTHFHLTVTFVCLYSTKTYLNGQGNLKVKVKIKQYQGEMKGNHFLSIHKCFCDLCVTWIVRL